MLETMLNHVESGYTQKGNPYHNNMHACDVLQTTHYFICQTGLAVSNPPFLKPKCMEELAFKDKGGHVLQRMEKETFIDLLRNRIG